MHVAQRGESLLGDGEPRTAGVLLRAPRGSDGLAATDDGDAVSELLRPKPRVRIVELQRNEVKDVRGGESNCEQDSRTM